MSKKTLRQKKKTPSLSIPEKATKILNIILIALFIIVIRIWHLGVIQHEAKLEESKKPQKRTLVEASKRATIRDRFNVPLALNQISYRASILYSQLKSIPSVAWEKDETGKKIKKFKRKIYIENLSQLLAKELNLDAMRIEDLIHSKGSFFGQVPFVIKEDLSEKEYYRLKMLEKDWHGIHVEKVPKRYYPQGKVACDILGYMGAINRLEYDKIIEEIKELEDFINGSDVSDERPLPKGVETLADAQNKLQELLDQAYTINDHVGKSGIEAIFEHVLRGFHGKKSFYSDARGNFLRELPGSKEPIAGQRVLLTISSELQAYAEELLTQNERIRETRLSKHQHLKTKQPWIKGGAIIAIDPKTSEILALASYPRVDPNDFIPSGDPDIAKEKIQRILRWFESEAYVGSIWDQKRPLERERFNDKTKNYYEDSLELNWNNFLTIILNSDSELTNTFKNITDLKTAVHIQENIDKLLILSEIDNLSHVLLALYGESITNKKPTLLSNEKRILIENKFKEHKQAVANIKIELDPYLAHLQRNYDRVLLVDLCRLAVLHTAFDKELLSIIGKWSIADHKKHAACYVTIKDVVKKLSRELFHDHEFATWRKENEKSFLKEKRALEKLAKQYPKPYLDHFEKEENKQFDLFWRQYQDELLLTFLYAENLLDLNLKHYTDFFSIWHEELEKGAHELDHWVNFYKTFKNSLKPLNKDIFIKYLHTLRGFNDLSRPLFGTYRYLKKENKIHLEKHLAAAFYPQKGYGYGRSQGFRQATTQGSIFKLITSYEALKQRHEKLASSKITPELLNPLTITDQIFKNGKETCVGYFQDGKPIPLHYNGGRMLKSHTRFLGKLDCLRAIENSSNPYFSLLAAEHMSSPKDLEDVAKKFGFGRKTGIELTGEITGKVPDDLIKNRTGLYAMANGQHTLVVTPLQTAVALSAFANGGKIIKPNILKLIVGTKANGQQAIQENNLDIKENLFMPTIIRNFLLTGMRKVVLKQLVDGLPSLSRFYKEYPGAIADYIDLKEVMVGKTSTSESMENIDLDAIDGTNLYTHVWFGGIVFDKEIPENTHSLLYRDEWGNPELVVVVYLKYGAWGKESAPIGAQMAKKWRDIKTKHLIK